MEPTVLEKVSASGHEEREFFTSERCFILEIWNHGADPDVSVARARVEPGVTTEMHTLSVDERYIIMSGRGRVEVEGLEARDVGPGDAVLIPRHRAQRIRNTGDVDLIFLCVCTPAFSPSCYRSLETGADRKTHDEVES